MDIEIKKQGPRCACREGWIDIYSTDGQQIIGKKRTGVPHDCRYIATRNDLIFEAERIATNQYSPDSIVWSGAFSDAMNRLAQERIFAC